MILNSFPQGIAVIMGFMAVFLCGCASPKVNFYTLSPIQDQIFSRVSSSVHKPIVGIGPVKMAEYLEQSQIITRSGENQVIKAEFDRWAGPLKSNFMNILAENLGFLLPGVQIQLYPWRTPEPIDYQVIMEVIRFEGRLGEVAWLDSRWNIFQGPERRLLHTGQSNINEPVMGPKYADLVAAQSRALGQLSREIARAIKNALSECEPAGVRGGL